MFSLPCQSRTIINNARRRMQQLQLLFPSLHSIVINRIKLARIINKWCHAVDAVGAPFAPDVHRRGESFLKSLA